MSLAEGSRLDRSESALQPRRHSLSIISVGFLVLKVTSEHEQAIKLRMEVRLLLPNQRTRTCQHMMMTMIINTAVTQIIGEPQRPGLPLPPKIHFPSLSLDSSRLSRSKCFMKEKYEWYIQYRLHIWPVMRKSRRMDGTKIE